MNTRFATKTTVAIAALFLLIGSAMTAGEAGAQAVELASQYVASPPQVDGVADAAWEEVPEISVGVVGGANAGNHQVTLKSVYTNDMVYFLVQWDDPTFSQERFPWVKQEDGTWIQLNDGSDHDENQFYEDKFAFIWDIKKSIGGFEQAGCMVTCHVGEENKAYGNKYTQTEGEIGDIWHWKSVRSNPVGYVDDQYVDAGRWTEDTTSAGRHSDSKDSGGYVNNKNEEGTGPAFMGPGGASDLLQGPFWLLDSEKQDFVDDFATGDALPGIIVAQPTGDRGDIVGKGEYSGDGWTLEIARKLVTGSEVDVQFDNMGQMYYFGVAAFDNAQVRHSFQTGVAALKFEARPTAAAELSWGWIKNMMAD